MNAAAALFVFVYEAVCAAVGKALALRDRAVQAARRQYLEARSHG